MNIYDLDTPALLVDIDRLERNINRMAQLCGDNDKRLRPHVKTHKTPQIAAMQIEAGAIGLTVAKLGEAEVMAKAGFRDIFIANQIVGATKLQRLINLAERIEVCVGVDSVENAAPISQVARKAGLRIPVRIEVDTGLHRAGVRTVKQAVDLAQKLIDMDGLRLTGLFTHEDHLYGLTAEQRAMACTQAANYMREVNDACLNNGLGAMPISVGSTPGAEFMALEPQIAEMRPGVYVFNDATQLAYGAALPDCALTVLVTVTSRPDEFTAIIDGGAKAFAADKCADRSAYGLVIEDPRAVFCRASEEHGVLDLTDAKIRPKVGEKLRVVPCHACACVNMHREMYAVRREEVEDEWDILGSGRFR